MAANEAAPFWDPGDTITCHASAAITGKRFVSVGTTPPNGGNPVVAKTGAGLGGVFGVSGYDAASGAKLMVWHAKAIIVPVTCSADVTCGDFVKSDANGACLPQGGSGVILGKALDTVASGGDVPIDRSITT